MKTYQRILDKTKSLENVEPTIQDIQSLPSLTASDPIEKKANNTKNQVETIILSGMRFVGDMKGAHDLYLNGELEGTVDLSALLFIGQSGRLVGEAKTENVIIEGQVEGTITARQKIEVRDGGKCKGDIFAPSVMISDKAYFQGQVTMIRDEEKTDAAPVIEKKQTFTRFDNTNQAPKITVVDDISSVTTKEYEPAQVREKVFSN
jgi:cytoskeletal protein CcmA (bactofilin family)